MADPTVGSLLDSVVGHLERRGLQVEAEHNDGEVQLLAQPSSSENLWLLVALIREGDGLALFYSVLPVDVPHEHRAAVAELVTRANFGLLGACFELDFADGECRCRTSVDLGSEAGNGFEPAQLDRLVDALVDTNLRTMDRYADAILDVARGAATPEAAIAAAER